MKKILVICIVMAAALVSGSFLYAAKSGRAGLDKQQVNQQTVVRSSKQIELFPSLFFF